MRSIKGIVSCLGGALLAASLLFSNSALADDGKIAVIDMQKVLATSNAGEKAEKVLEKKRGELLETLKKDESGLVAMQKEIEKKSSAWKDSVKKEKAIEFNKKRRALAEKQNDANKELKQLQDKHVAPIMKEVKKIVEEVADKEGYDVVMPKNMVLFAVDSVDITDDVIDELNDALK